MNAQAGSFRAGRKMRQRKSRHGIMQKPINKLVDTFAVLKPNLQIQTVEHSPSLYADLAVRFSGFKGHVLISSHEFTGDWPTWERHPAGDEIVMLLSGEATLIMQTSAGDETVMLDEPGSYVVIPHNTWHTARVSRPARMLFITPGEGTENHENPGV
jgi:mannose-6-phosphate isomerase-like protein (cupin superfamily)